MALAALKNYPPGPLDQKSLYEYVNEIVEFNQILTNGSRDNTSYGKVAKGEQADTYMTKDEAMTIITNEIKIRDAKISLIKTKTSNILKKAEAITPVTAKLTGVINNVKKIKAYFNSLAPITEIALDPNLTPIMRDLITAVKNYSN